MIRRCEREMSWHTAAMVGTTTTSPASAGAARHEPSTRTVQFTWPVSVAISKRLLWEGIVSSVPEMMKRENKVFAYLGNQPDAREGVVSFLEKRPPEWKLSPSRDKPEDF